METVSKFEVALDELHQAVGRLEEVLGLEKNDIIRDSAIQRFEFSLDLAWKTVKAWLEERKGVRCASPKDCFREAFRQGLIEYDEYWLVMVDLRNETVHTYNQKMAEKVFKELPTCLEHFKKLLTSF